MIGRELAVRRVGMSSMIIVTSAVGYRRLTRIQLTPNAEQVPMFQVDASWPKPLPNRWLLGSVIGVAVDSRGHLWIVHRPKSLQPSEVRAAWKSAPPVLEFDQQGNLVQSWGGPGSGYEWPQIEHGMCVDYEENVWLGGGGQKNA